MAAVPYSSPWALYQRKIYGTRQAPPFSTSLSALQSLAREKISRDAYWYAAGSAGEGKTDAGNVAAFDKWQIVSLCIRTATKELLLTTWR